MISGIPEQLETPNGEVIMYIFRYIASATLLAAFLVGPLVASEVVTSSTEKGTQMAPHEYASGSAMSHMDDYSQSFQIYPEEEYPRGYFSDATVLPDSRQSVEQSRENGVSAMDDYSQSFQIYTEEEYPRGYLGDTSVLPERKPSLEQSRENAGM